MTYELNELFDNVFILKSFFKRLKGLMFKEDIPNDDVYVLKTSSIHTFFMKFGINVLYLNKKKEVIYKSYISPGKIGILIPNVEFVIETKKDILLDIEIGDRILFED